MRNKLPRRVVRPAAAAGLVAEELVAAIEERTVASFRGALPGTMKADAEQAKANAMQHGVTLRPHQT